MYNKKNIKNRGFTLIEILLVVGFIALAGIGVYIVYDKVQTTNAANQEVRDLTLLKTGIQNLYATSPNYNAITMKTIIDAKVVPETMQISGETIKTRLGADIQVYQMMVNSKMSVVITYSNLPVPLCTKILTNAAANFEYVLVGGSFIKNSFANPPAPLNVSATSQFCNQQVSYIPIMFGFK